MIETKVSAVSYINSYPFVFGLQQKDISEYISLSLDNPAQCADKLLNNKADIGLVPVIILNELDYFQTLTKYCIGAVNNVQTVVLFSSCPIQKIKKIYLDSQSRSSNILCKVLAKFYWKKKIIYETITIPSLPELKDQEAAILIGDRVFQTSKGFNYRYDLSKEWFDYTGLPFVFAVWATNKDLDPEFVKHFEMAIDYGIKNIDMAIETLAKEEQKDILKDYYTKNISYIFDREKASGMELFLKLAENL